MRRRWEAAADAFAGGVRGYQAARGADVEGAQVQSTIRINSTLVPQRAATIVGLVEALTDLQSMAGRRVLEVGTGFGALAAYLAMTECPQELLGVDIRTDLVETALESSEAAGIKGVSYAVADMRSLPNEWEDRFDLIVANNAFIYLPTVEGMRQALAEFARVLRPGGWVAFWHVNRWQFREPFTKAPMVHLLPPPLAEALSRTVGWRHNHGRTRYVSPRDLRSLLRKERFTDVQFGLDGRATSLLTASAKRFYGACGRAPGHARPT